MLQLSCIANFVPEYCGSTSNTTCICNNTDLTAAVYACAYAACDTIPELLQLQKYSAISCGVENDKARLNAVLMMDYIVPFLTALFLAGRIAARIRLDVGLGADDWTILAAAAAYFIDGEFPGFLVLSLLPVGLKTCILRQPACLQERTIRSRYFLLQRTSLIS